MEYASTNQIFQDTKNNHLPLRFYGFLLSAIDAALTPSTDVDLYRIKIGDKDNQDQLVYDNQVGEDDDAANPTTAIEGGNIKISQQGLEKPIVSYDQTAQDNPKTPDMFKLYQNYPNPFNPSTMIQYDVPKECFVSLSIYNTKGQKVKTLLNETLPAGNYVTPWNSRDDTANQLPSGIYFLDMRTSDFKQTVSMLLLK